jgi:uncharacterized membrane protein
MSWFGFVGIFALFFVTHSVPVRPAVKGPIVNAIGPRGFTISYSVLSIGMLALLIWAASEAPFVELWLQMTWQRHVVHLGMLAVCLILAFSVARPNPFSFGGTHNHAFDPARPGIVRLTRHPILIAMALWAALHLLPNGDLAHVILFGVLGGFALVGRGLINRRKQRVMGADVWNDLNDVVAKSSYLTPPQSVMGAFVRCGAGVFVFVALLMLHPIVIGVSAI